MALSSLPPTHIASLPTPDGTCLFTQAWQPETEAPRGVVLLVHGHAEHSGRYAHVAKHLVEHGIAMYAYDHRGFGRSEGHPGLVASFDQLVDDLAQMVQTVRADMPADQPLHLLAHSMGGAVAILYGLDHSPPVDGMILSSPAIDVSQNASGLLRSIAPLVGRLCPTLPTLPRTADAISRDPAVVRDAETDPFNYHGRLLAGTGAELLHASERIQSAAHRFTLPFFIFHGTADWITAPEASRAFYRRAASPDKTILLYDGLYHETMNEPEREQVLHGVTNWLEARLDRPT